MSTRLRRLALVQWLLAATAGIGITSAQGAAAIVQTNWTIVSATGTTHYVVSGSSGTGAARWTFEADITVTWKQTASNATRPGARTASFNFTSMARYAPGRAGAQRSAIRDVAATAVGSASSSGYYGSGSCGVSGSVPKGFFSGSAANELFLDSRRTASQLVAYVEGQNPHATVVKPGCNVSLPHTYDVAHEQIKYRPLSLVQARTKGTRARLILLRTVPIVEQDKRVGRVTERSTVVLVLQSGF